MHILQITQLSSKIPVVRASAVYILLDCIKSVKQVPTSDASMFPEYILPCLMPLCHDKQREVRAAFASVVASVSMSLGNSIIAVNCCKI